MSGQPAVDENKRDVYESLWFTREGGPIGGLMTFNADYGFIEAIVRGLRSGFLKSFEYRQLTQCESLDDVKLTLGDTDYLNVLQNVNKLTPEIILKRCEDKFVAEFNVRTHTHTAHTVHADTDCAHARSDRTRHSDVYRGTLC